MIAQITCQSIRSTVRAAATVPVRSPSSNLDTASTSAACTKASDRLGNHIDAVVGGMAVSDEDFTRADRSRRPRRRTGERRQPGWSGVPVFGGLFFVDSPELALQDWLGAAGFDRPEDYWPRQWANAHVDFAAVEKRAWFTPE